MVDCGDISAIIYLINDTRSNPFQISKKDSSNHHVKGIHVKFLW